MKYFRPQHFSHLDDLKDMRLASFKARSIAFVIDFTISFFLFLALVAGAVYFLRYMDWLNLEEDYKIEFGFSNIYTFVFLVLYFSILTYWGKGRTPGKKLMKIRVVSLVHPRLSFWHCIERALGYAASTLELGFGFFQFFIHPNRQTVHDRIAETIVISESKK
jgi:uncharacterized RDD family membrane protein YckC